jgi:hypothetical protein
MLAWTSSGYLKTLPPVTKRQHHPKNESRSIAITISEILYRFLSNESLLGTNGCKLGMVVEFLKDGSVCLDRTGAVAMLTYITTLDVRDLVTSRGFGSHGIPCRNFPRELEGL